MDWSPTSGAAVALLAVLAFAAGAGAFAGADVGGGPGVPDGDTATVTVATDHERRSGGKPGVVEKTVQEDLTPTECVDCRGPTARSLLSVVPAPSPAVLAGAAVLLGLFAVAVGRQRGGATPPAGSGAESDLPGGAAGAGDGPVAAPGVDGDNAVYRAWERLTERVGGGPTLTPGERARRAVDRGFPRADVDRLWALFEEVRYGDRPVTDDLEARARETARELGLEAASEQGVDEP